MDKENLVAASKPKRTREIKTTEIPGKDMGMMRLLTREKILDSESIEHIPDQHIYNKAVLKPLPTGEITGVYHEVFKPNQKFLVPDTTLQDMKKIVNSQVRRRRSIYFKNETDVGPVETHEIPDKLDAILEFINEMEIIPSEIPVQDREKYIEKILEEEEESEESVSYKSEEFKPIKLKEPLKCVSSRLVDLLPGELGQTTFNRVTHQTLNEVKNKKIHLRILGYYTDMPYPKFKIQKYNDGNIFETTNNFDKTNKPNTYKFNLDKRLGKKANVSISTQLFKKAPKDFLKTFNKLDETELSDRFNIMHKIHNSTNSASETALCISGKFVSETAKKAVLPVLSIQVNKTGANTNKKITKKYRLNKLFG